MVYGGYAYYCSIFSRKWLDPQEVMILQGSYSLMIALMEIPAVILPIYLVEKTMVFGTFFCFLGFII